MESPLSVSTVWQVSGSVTAGGWQWRVRLSSSCWKILFSLRDTSYTFDNPRVEMDSAIQSLFTALGISIVLIYLLLAFQFNSLWIPLVILITIRSDL